jgi:hypothetical protein
MTEEMRSTLAIRWALGPAMRLRVMRTPAGALRPPVVLFLDSAVFFFLPLFFCAEPPLPLRDLFSLPLLRRDELCDAGYGLHRLWGDCRKV